MSSIIFVSGRKHDMVAEEGFLYAHHRKEKSGLTSFVCTEKGKASGCKARVHLRGENKVRGPIPEHSHPPDHGKVGAAIAMGDMKVRARETTEPSSRVVQAAKRQLPDEAVPHLPRDESMKRAVKRIRGKMRPCEPKGLLDLKEVDRRYEVDGDGVHWLLGDNKDVSSRCLVFCPEDNLLRLAQSSYWVMDGTFKVSPSVFQQIYVIHGHSYGTWVPLAFALMAKKNRCGYTFLFKTLIKASQQKYGRTLAPKYIAVDFESVVINLIGELFPDSKVAGCLFHLTQIFWRVLQRVGLAAMYAEKEELRKSFRALCGLALVPEEDVVECFMLWKRNAPNAMGPIVEHVEQLYVLGKRWGRGRRAPKYPPSTWNCCERVQDGRPRTSNTAEGWNNRLRVLVGKHHPSLYEFLDAMKLEIADAKRTVLQNAYGRSPPKKRVKWDRVDRQIESMVDRYAEYKRNDDLLLYIEGIGHNLSGRFAKALENDETDDSESPQVPMSPSGSPQCSRSPNATSPSCPPVSARRSGREWLVQSAQEDGYQVIDKGGAGDCMFLSLQACLAHIGRRVTVQRLRDLAADEMSSSERRHLYCDRFAPVANAGSQSFPAFVRQTRVKEWGTEVTLLALTAAIPARISVYATGIEQVQTLGRRGEELAVGHIHDEGHYVALVK